MKFLNRIHTTMKTRLAPLVPTPSCGPAKAMAGQRCPDRAALHPSPWTGALRTAPPYLFVLAMALVWILASPAVHAGPPEAMTYQGFLVDANGNPLATNNPANYPVIFRIFAAPSGGSSLWSEQQIVTVDNGNFSVILSEGTLVGEPKPLLSAVMGTNGADRYIQLSVTIGGSTLDMLPRMRLLPAPYAFLSTSASQLVNPAGAAVVTYANSRVEVPGTFFAGGYAGNGSGLSGLTAAQIGAGTFADARLSLNVALRAGGNTFTGDQIISGNLGIGGPPVDGVLDVEGDMHVNDHDLYFRGGNDHNHGLGFYGAGKPFGGVVVDGPVLYGFSGGGLGSRNFGGDKLALTWDGNGDVGIGTTAPTGKLTVNGGVVARGGPPGLNNTNDNGFAFTGNGGDIDSGMFSSADGQVEFYASNVERMRVTTNGVSVNGTISATNEVRFGTASQYNALGGSAPMRIVSGLLPGAPAPNQAVSGPGWTAQGLPNNNWRVNFTTSFTAGPAVVCNWILPSSLPWNGANTPSAPVVSLNSGLGFTVYAGTQASDTSGFNTTCSVSFIAVGLR